MDSNGLSGKTLVVDKINYKWLDWEVGEYFLPPQKPGEQFWQTK